MNVIALALDTDAINECALYGGTKSVATVLANVESVAAYYDLDAEELLAATEAWRTA